MTEKIEKLRKKVLLQMEPIILEELKRENKSQNDITSFNRLINIFAFIKKHKKIKKSCNLNLLENILINISGKISSNNINEFDRELNSYFYAYRKLLEL